MKEKVSPNNHNYIIVLNVRYHWSDRVLLLNSLVKRARDKIILISIIVLIQEEIMI
jgi:hypothetical protein